MILRVDGRRQTADGSQTPCRACRGAVRSSDARLPRLGRLADEQASGPLHELTDRFPSEERFGLVVQTRRAAISVSAKSGRGLWSSRVPRIRPVRGHCYRFRVRGRVASLSGDRTRTRGPNETAEALTMVQERKATRRSTVGAAPSASSCEFVTGVACLHVSKPSCRWTDTCVAHFLAPSVFCLAAVCRLPSAVSRSERRCRSERDVSVLLRGEGLSLGAEHLESSDQFVTGLTGLDHLVDEAELGCDIGIVEPLLVVGDEIRARLRPVPWWR